jgi:hypothetical protein
MNSTTMDTPAGSLKMILVLRASLALLRVRRKKKLKGPEPKKEPFIR